MFRVHDDQESVIDWFLTDTANTWDVVSGAGGLVRSPQCFSGVGQKDFGLEIRARSTGHGGTKCRHAVTFGSLDRNVMSPLGDISDA